MPIRAASDRGDIHAFALSEEQWSEVKATYRSLNLHMPCCGVPAVPKTSTRGTFFFAHARRGECNTADESPEHLYCKSLIAKAAQDAGWTVTTERPGVSPDGEAWVADVFCEKGNAKVALEVQMSPQADEETLRRQLRYQRSGVRCAWFFGVKARRETICFERDTPAFSLCNFVAGELPVMEMFEASLPDFVTALLEKRVVWTIPNYSRPQLVEFIEDTCWSCRKQVKQVLQHQPGGDSPGDVGLTPENFYEGRWIQTAYTVASLSNMLEKVHSDISNKELTAQGLNLVDRKDVIRGKPTRFPFCNLCLYCHAPQDNFFLSKHVYSRMRQQAQVEEPGIDTNGNESTREQPSTGFGIAVVPREVLGTGMWVLLK